MSGLKFFVNNQELASVSNHNRNILSAYVSGDLIGPELATASMIGGYYGEPEETVHRIWLDDYEIKESDVIEIQFLDSVSTFGSGMSIEEHAAIHANDEKAEESNSNDMYSWLARQPKVRELFLFELEMPNKELIKSKTSKDDFSFHFGVMWKWTKPEVASVQLSSTSLDKMEGKLAGKTHGKFNLESGQGIKFRVGT